MDANIILKDEADSLEDYCQTLRGLIYLQEFEETYTVTRRTAKTWDSYGQYLPNELLSSQFRRTRIECGRFFVYCLSILENLYPKVLAEEFSDSPKSTENVLSKMSTSQLEELLYHFGIIEGGTKEELKNIRGRRNTFAHDHEPQQSYYRNTKLLADIDRQYGIISEFVERVYNRSLSDIANYISNCYEIPMERHERLQDYPTAYLLKIYREIEPEMAAFPSGFQEEVREEFEKMIVPLPIDIEGELERRGYDPTNVTDVVPPARRPLEYKQTEYSIEDTYIEITLDDCPDMIGWDHDLELSFGVNLLDYYSYNGKNIEEPPKQATAILLLDNTVVDTKRVTPVPEVGTRRDVSLSYTLNEEFYSTPIVQIRYGIIVEGENRYHMSVRDESLLNIVPVSLRFTEAKFRLRGLTVDDRSEDDLMDTLRAVRSKLDYVEQAIGKSMSGFDLLPNNNIEEMSHDELLDEIETLSEIIEVYGVLFGAPENSTTGDHY